MPSEHVADTSAGFPSSSPHFPSSSPHFPATSTLFPDTSAPIPDTYGHFPDSASPAAAHPSGGSHMSVEEFVALSGRDRLPRLQPGFNWFKDSGNGISKSINRMLNGMVQHPYPTYNAMPVEEREVWFRQFAQEFNWDPTITAAVRTAFNKKAAVMYSRKMNEWKNAWTRNYVPREMQFNPTLWNGFIAYWTQEASKASAALHSQNRKSERKGKGIATHNLGATSLETKAKQLFRAEGVAPSALRLIEVAHTNKTTHEIQDGVAREIVENVRKMEEDFLLTQPDVAGTPAFTEVPVEKINEFVLECTPRSRGRIFGLPDDEYASSASSHFYGDSTAALRAEVERNRAEVERTQAEHEAQMEEMRATVRQLQEAAAAERARYAADQAAMFAKMDAIFSQLPGGSGGAGGSSAS